MQRMRKRMGWGMVSSLVGRKGKGKGYTAISASEGS
jgi:hypothetical protein